jgi:hypothetical protein
MIEPSFQPDPAALTVGVADGGVLSGVKDPSTDPAEHVLLQSSLAPNRQRLIEHQLVRPNGCR